MMWVIGVMTMTALFLFESNSEESRYITLKIILYVDNVFVISGAILTIITDIIYGVYTNWGFFKYKWISLNWIISIMVIIFGTFYFKPNLLEAINLINKTHNNINESLVEKNMIVNIYTSFTQSISLIILVGISVYKPWKKKNK